MKKILKLSDLILSNKINKKHVLIRSDLNVPQNISGKITDYTKIYSSIPAIQLSLNAGAFVIIMSHIGRPKKQDSKKPKYSLYQVSKKLSNILQKKVIFIKNWINKKINFIKEKVILLENCRFNEGEINNCKKLSKKIAKLCDIYVNDAFGCSHRNESTTCGIIKYAKISCIGPLFNFELKTLKKFNKQNKNPLIAFIGGSKISSKLKLLKSLIKKVDKLIIGGGIANMFMFIRGFNIGKSIIEKNMINKTKEIIKYAEKINIPIIIPIDVIIYNKIKKIKHEIKNINNIKNHDFISDIGPITIKTFINQIKEAKSIIWNGPLGIYEINKFEIGTQIIAKTIAESTAYSIIGGGDTISILNKYNLCKKINHISTGGGAFLSFLNKKKIKIIEMFKYSN